MLKIKIQKLEKRLSTTLQITNMYLFGDIKVGFTASLKMDLFDYYSSRRIVAEEVFDKAPSEFTELRGIFVQLKNVMV